MRLTDFGGRAAILSAAIFAGCQRTPEAVLRVQGTVTSLGYLRPVKSAEVVVDWPAQLGGGSSTIQTDAEGHFAIGRSVRTLELDCKGVAVTVRAKGFASAYNQSNDDCDSAGRLTADFKLFPMPH